VSDDVDVIVPTWQGQQHAELVRILQRHENPNLSSCIARYSAPTLWYHLREVTLYHRLEITGVQLKKKFIGVWKHDKAQKQAVHEYSTTTTHRMVTSEIQPSDN